MRLSFGKAAVWFGVTVASAVMAFAAVQTVDLPDGPGKKVLESSCTNCHDLKELNKFKGIYKSKEWNELVMNMIGYGAKVPDDQVPVLVVDAVEVWIRALLTTLRRFAATAAPELN